VPVLKEKHFSIFVFLTSGFFLLLNLGDWPLWQDEANAALVGKNILSFGVPKVFDGRNYIAYVSTDVTQDHLWRLWGWFPLYLNALTFWIFGVSTWGARLFYALSGIFFMQYFYRAVKRLNPETSIAKPAAILVLFCVPLLLHFRQCNYYTAAIFFSTWLFFKALETQKKKSDLLQMVGASFLLFNSHFLIWVLTFSSVSLIWFIQSFIEKRNLLSEGRYWIAAFLVNLPFFWIYRPWELKSTYSQTSLSVFLMQGVERIKLNVEFLFIPVLPFAFIIFILFVYLIWGQKKVSTQHQCQVWLTTLFIVCYLFGAAAVIDSPYFRYLVPIVPILLYWMVLLGTPLLNHQSWLKFLFLGFFLWFQIFGMRQSHDGKTYSLLSQFYYELTHRNDDVNEALIHFLKNNAKEGDQILTNYGAYPLIYYTDLEVGGGSPLGFRVPEVPQPVEVSAIEKPEWIILRKPWAFHNIQLEAILQNGSYQKHSLQAVDTPWGNRPSPYFHRYATELEGPRLEIFQRDISSGQ